MAYAVRATRKSEEGEVFVTATTIVYVETVAEALTMGALRLKVPESQLTVDKVDDGMNDAMIAAARELVPGQDQNPEDGMVANVTDEMRGAAQSKVYGSD